MAAYDLDQLVRDKLNITWDDELTARRYQGCLAEGIPAVCSMVGLTYDASTEAVTAPDGTEVDLSVPSLERTLLLNWVAYEWSHKAELFEVNYHDMIAASRQHWQLAADEEETDGDGESAESV